MALSWGIHLQPSWAKALPPHPRVPGNEEAMTAQPFGAQPPSTLSYQGAQSLLTALFFINTLLLVTALSFTAAPCLVSPFRSPFGEMNRDNEL